MNLNNDIAVVRAREAGERPPLRLGPLHQLHPGLSRGLIRHHNRLHPAPPSMSAIWNIVVSVARCSPRLARTVRRAPLGCGRVSLLAGVERFRWENGRWTVNLS